MVCSMWCRRLHLGNSEDCGEGGSHLQPLELTWCHFNLWEPFEKEPPGLVVCKFPETHYTVVGSPLILACTETFHSSDLPICLITKSSCIGFPNFKISCMVFPNFKICMFVDILFCFLVVLLILGSNARCFKNTPHGLTVTWWFCFMDLFGKPRIQTSQNVSFRTQFPCQNIPHALDAIPLVDNWEIVHNYL